METHVQYFIEKLKNLLLSSAGYHRRTLWI